MRVRAVVAYDGTEYHGFQRQANAPTVQETLETALAEVAQEAVTIFAAGRTDAGVHAVGQVIALDTNWRHPIGDLQRAMNAVLPFDIAVRELAEVAPDFHPRYDACSRHYRYTVYEAPVRSPLNRRYCLHTDVALDLAAMQQAAEVLVGEHDFATFGQPPQGEITVRRVLKAEWREKRVGDIVPVNQKANLQRYLYFDIEGNAFLYRMVRSVVGTLLEVGQGKMTVEAFREALLSCDRSRAGQTALPHALCLMEVKY